MFDIENDRVGFPGHYMFVNSCYNFLLLWFQSYAVALLYASIISDLCKYQLYPSVSFYFKLCRGGWVFLYAFICLSAEALELEPSYFATTLFHHASPKVTSVLVLFVIFGGLF